MKINAAILVGLLCVTGSAFAEDTLRCGNKLVRTGMTMAEVRQYCGNPTSAITEEQDVRAGPRVVGKTEVHTWTYRRMSGQRTAVLHFDQDELKAITYESK